MRRTFALAGLLVLLCAQQLDTAKPPVRSCSNETSFLCNDGRCIPAAWRCDGDPDCPDEADEKNCPSTCMDEEYKCGKPTSDGRSRVGTMERFKCIPKKWVCDGEFDCEDKSDEVGCKNVTCQENQFQCEEISGDYSLCIPKTWVCDGQRDCTNGLDEANCSKQVKKCPDTSFQCADGSCIFNNWKCDQEIDCEDGSDEFIERAPSFCNKTLEQCAPDTMFKCGSGECIPKRWKCDHETDCKDHSDEKDCPATQHTCKIAEQFACKSSQRCIGKKFVCDGEPDCPDGSDEDDCPNRECVKGERECPATYAAYGAESGHKICIPSSSWCNGVEDCPDGGDEKGCNFTAADCKVGVEFKCPSTPLQCIELKKLCTSSSYDCGDRSLSVCDQPKIIGMCERGQDGCQCRPSYVLGKSVCHCKDGYELVNGKCQDINECNIPGSCDHICINTPGSFRCSCHSHYQLAFRDGKDGSGKVAAKCQASGADPLVLLTNRHTIHQYDIKNKGHLPISEKPGSAIAMDYHMNNGTLIWSDVANKRILQCTIGNTTNPLLGTKQCDETHEVLLDKDQISAPDGIAIDWVHDLLFWTDGGLDQIRVMDLKTGKQRVLYSSDLEEPRAIAVDPEYGLIFWTDWGKNARIERSGMDGQHRAVIVDGDRVVWPNGLALDYLAKRIYWADAKIKSIFSADYYGHDVQVILHSHDYLRHPFSMSVFEDRVYYTDWEHEGVITINKFTGEDLRIVMKDVKSPMTVRIYHKQAQPEIPNKCLYSSCEHLCLPRAHIREMSRKDEKAWHDKPFSCACEGNTVSAALECIADLETKSGFSMFTIFFLLCIGVVIAGGFVVARRKLGPRSFVALNFDNPIYRRTTEEGDHQMEDPFRDPFAEPPNNRGRNDGLPTLASADNESRGDALSF